VDLKKRVAVELAAARDRSLALLEPLSDRDQSAQHSPLMSPVIWDLAHIGNYEELWLVRTLAGRVLAPELDTIYNPFENPRFVRGRLPFLRPPEARRYVADVRDAALDVLDELEFDPAQRLLDAAFVYGMVVQHEHQHDETMLAALQLRPDPYPFPSEPPMPDPAPDSDAGSAMVFVDGGPFVMGTDVEPWAYDNERTAHEVDVEPFFIDRTPVTNRAYLEFVDGAGYRDERWWTPAGWAWRREAGLEHPQFWRRHGGGSWSRTRFGHEEDLPLDEPVQHVCWYEADAYARFRGLRLPTEAEWEKAASWDPIAGRKRRYPWGDGDPDAHLANLGQRRFGPVAAGSFVPGASAYGCVQMIGDVWEWTSSDFLPYPGFGSFPYREYSEVFYGSEYKVLRGGSWATHPLAIRTTFRNWDLPIRRQIFTGLRCARDAA
jgi:iron(II)-dependent oxidoreductase